MLLPATADDADDDEFDADEKDKDDGGNPNRAILADKSSSSVSLSRFHSKSNPGKINYSSFVECGTPPPSVPLVLLLSLALPKGFVLAVPLAFA